MWYAEVEAKAWMPFPKYNNNKLYCEMRSHELCSNENKSEQLIDDGYAIMDSWWWIPELPGINLCVNLQQQRNSGSITNAWHSMNKWVNAKVMKAQSKSDASTLI